MADYFDNIAKQLFENDLKDVQINSRDIPIHSTDTIEGVIVETLKDKGIIVDNYDFLIGIAIWEYNVYVNKYLYENACVWNGYQDAVNKYINEYCKKYDIPHEVLQAIESAYHWKSTRKLASEYSAPISVIYSQKTRQSISGETEFEKKWNAYIPQDTSQSDSEIAEFDNFWDACVPCESGIIPIGLLLRNAIDINNTIVDKDFINRIESIEVCYGYVAIINDALRRNLVDAFFYYKQSNLKVAQLVFEALEYFVPSTFNHSLNLILAPLVAIHGLYLTENGYLTPMKYLEHNYHSKDGFTDDLFVSNVQLVFNVRGSFAPLVKQWEEWRGLVLPCKNLCNMIFSVVLGLQEGKEADSNYYYKKITDKNCKKFVDDVLRIKSICSSLDEGFIDSYLQDREDKSGRFIRIDKESFHIDSCPPRDINSMICDLDIPTRSGAAQIDEAENASPKKVAQPVNNPTCPHDNTSLILKRAETWPLPFDFFETDYIDETCKEGDYIPGFLSGIVDFSLIGTDVTGEAMKKGFQLSGYFSELINALAKEGCFKNDDETKLAFARALTGRRIKRGVKWEGSTFGKWANVMCYLTWRLYGGKYDYISKVFPELLRIKKLQNSYAKNLKKYDGITSAIDVFLNKVKYLYSNKQEEDTQVPEQPSSPE